jgi:hypothetical protein
MRSKSLLAAGVVALLATGCYPAGPLTEEDMAAITGVGQAYQEALLAGR